MKHRSGYFKTGLAVFLTVSAVLLFYDTCFGSRALPSVVGKLMIAVKPIAYGAFMAYLLSPVVNFFEQTLFPARVRQAKERGLFSSAGIRAVSILLTWALVGAALYLLASVLLPELYKSVLQLVGNVGEYYLRISRWVEHMLETYPALESWAAAQMDSAFQKASAWLGEDVLDKALEALSQAQSVVSAAAGGVASLVIFLKDLLVGAIVSIYLLATKEGCAALGRKLAYSVFPQKEAHWVLRGVIRGNEIFSGFVRGKLLDSLIIGILCFIGCSVLNFPYTPLISVFIGVTNIIPFFGPFLGAIPSAFLILLVSPLKALYFLIFVLVLQQLDGNVIGPKILGDKTGLSSLWVMIAILVGGSFFGVPGMFFGVPVFACARCLFDFLLDARLRRRGLPVEMSAYTSSSGPAEGPPAPGGETKTP